MVGGRVPHRSMNMPLELAEHEEGVVLPVRAKARARRTAIEGPHDRRLKVSVTAAPEKGKANRAILALLAKALGVPVSALAIIAGKTSSEKRILIRTLDPTAVRAALERAVGGTDKQRG